MSNPVESHNDSRSLADRKADEQFDRLRADYLWAMRETALLERYLGQVIVLHNRMVLGSGRDHIEALESAQQGAAARQQSLPNNCELLFINVPEQIWFPADFWPSSQAPSNG